MAHATEAGSSKASSSSHVSSKHEAAAPPDATEPLNEETRLRRAEGMVRRNVYWALGIGLVPFPIVDILGVTAMALKLIKDLSDLYEVKFTENTAKSVIGSLAVSIGAVGIGEVIAGSLIKLIPVVGQVVGVVGVSILAGAFTQALGNAFIMHFESGGTLLNFRPEEMRAHFQREFTKAKSSVEQLQRDEKTKSKSVA